MGVAWAGEWWTKGADGLDHMWGVEVWRGEHGLNGPGPEPSQVDADGGHRETQPCTVGNKTEGVGLGNGKQGEVVELAE